MARPGNKYEGAAGHELAAQYEAIDPAQIHEAVIPHLPTAPAAILDVGAGSGRDAAWLAALGHTVLAVEPSTTMREEAQRRHPHTRITWLADSLPSLEAVYRLGAAFDVVLLSAVWMHVAPAERARAFRKLVTLLKPGGILALSLRLGPPVAGRDMHPVDLAEVEALARRQGLVMVTTEVVPDRLGRPEITWVQIVLRLPDDGTEALPLLRHVILNDAKSATYKLGLLRAVARAADGAQGLARFVGDTAVAVPLGLIALNWLRLYKPLVAAGLPQTPTNWGTKGLGFIKDGWHGITDMPATDLRVGTQVTGVRAAALHAALGDAAATIARMPATYMTYPGSQSPILPAARERVGGLRAVPLVVDANYLRSFGELQVPLHLWRALARHDAWIEPALVYEWTRLMEGYARRQHRELDAGQLARAMRWHEPERGVTFARRVAADVMASGKLFCVWSGRRLSETVIDIDHCLPWSAWPCDDLWNLLPAHPQINRHSKRDRLPSADALEASQERIFDWCRRAWLHRENTATRFYTEARASLPMLPETGGELSAVFSGIQARRFTLRADQQVIEWSP
ncbi:class I SAM-dependent methyltransferase [Paracoccus sediminilitoris]|uniref:class I SAM-dependent methyltransferase n=1 Tax=Paracoccus sediminilitoris TaxID=2202419 RepID=UPI00272A4C34|nr:class I SAM-dependent methyltransferase [Paracoccus sediminilitoris]